MNQPVILFRRDESNEKERDVASKHFWVFASRSSVAELENSVVIGRYSVLPFYNELCLDLELNNKQLVNSLQQHRYIADFDWYYDIPLGLTPRTWFLASELPEGQFVVKGRTNSRKNRWDTHMFAKSRMQAIHIGAELMCDPLICDQGVVYREFVPLVTYEYGITGCPVTNEWRFFYYGKQRLCFGYYWHNSEQVGEMTWDGLVFADKIAEIIAEKVPFFVIDVAQKIDGSWTLIEVNDGQMSGLSCCDPEKLYSNLAKCFGMEAK